MHALQEADVEFEGLVGRTPPMVEVFESIARVAPWRTPVLVAGETGTGKELVARAIHRHGPARAQRFVALDCATLTEDALARELGTERAAGSADGTLFLNEVGALGRAAQATLARFLDTPTPRGPRILAATARDLSAAVAARRFREDLRDRLAAVTISIPPLRERREDIRLLADHLARSTARACGAPVANIAEPALALLEAHDWPGNVRQLADVLERAVSSTPHVMLEVGDLPAELRSPFRTSVLARSLDRPTLKDLKRRYVHDVLLESGGNVSRAASVLGIDRRSLYRMLQRYGIDRAL
jgi:DNA-binding NtrC family response regulator